MNRALVRYTTYLQLVLAVLMASGCSTTQPFFAGESPDLQYYLNAATRIEYPDVEVDSLAETTMATEPLSIGNHDYQFWDLSVEECVSIALQNAKFFVTTSGNAEFRQNVAAQFTSASADQLGSIYDVAIQQSTTQSIPLTVDGSGNRTLPRGVLRANQVGGVEDALSEFDAQASGFLNYSNTDRPRNTGALNTVNPQFFTADDLTQQFALSKRYATGGVATLRQQIIYSKNNAEVGPISRAVASDYTAVIEAQVQHPLMRNRGTLINRIPVVLASLNEDVAIADFEIQVRNLVRDVEVAYWNLYVAYRSVSTSVIGRNSAIATAKFAQLNLENGTGTIQEVAQANGQYYNFRARLEGALSGSNLPGDDRFGVYGAERVMRELMGLAPTDGRLIRPIQEPSLARVAFDWEEITTQMLYLSPELRKGRTVIKQRELEQMSAKNQLLPEVNLSLLYRWVGVGDELGFGSRADANGPLPGSSALTDLTGGDYQEGAVRLEFTPPAIGGRRERARIRGSQLRLHQSRAFLQDAERLMVSQISDAIAKTATHYQLVQTYAQVWQQAETEVESRLTEFKGGRTQINVVLQSQQRRADAQIAYYRALAEYNKSLNYVDYLKGTMLANSNITLSEGPWNKKAYWDALERARERSAGKHKVYGVSRPNVVRQGPLRDAASASQPVGSGVIHDGQLPPEMSWSGSDANMDPMGANVMPMDESVTAPQDIPLGEMGNSPSDLRTPGSTPMREPLPTPDPLPMMDSLPDSFNGAGEVRQMSFQQQATGSSKAGQNKVHVGDVQIDGAPLPVRRTPLPNR
ncbi:Outer membrane efflux protein [Rubripirellula tenax]|uniref:Outer membrane efflux protein n=1 Tax=Rubripirellula tenax TaxID=2528015 RepID=A0A5C6F200_9BACT|nr:TolC family protein [Rubripirellula tenax]TWU54624.1 Outer membrane efflux protein [Rubripirellula tenax]